MVRKSIINIIFLLISLVGYSQHNFFFNQHYGEGVTPIAPPVVETGPAQSITSTSAQLHGESIDPGGETPSILGIVYATHINPTTLDSYGGGSWFLGVYWVDATGLQPNTTYYYRAFAENSGGIGYGEQLSFTTLPAAGSIPTVVLDSVSIDVSITSILAYGNVTNDGGSTVIERGFVWSNIENPSINDSKISIGSGIGVYNSWINELSCGMTYYIKAYAINNIGVAYSNEITFVTGSEHLPTEVLVYAIFNSCGDNYGITDMTLPEIEAALSIFRNCTGTSYEGSFQIKTGSFTIGNYIHTTNGCYIYAVRPGYYLSYDVNISEEPIRVVKIESGIITEIHYK